MGPTVLSKMRFTSDESPCLGQGIPGPISGTIQATGLWSQRSMAVWLSCPFHAPWDSDLWGSGRTLWHSRLRLCSCLTATLCFQPQGVTTTWILFCPGNAQTSWGTHGQSLSVWCTALAAGLLHSSHLPCLRLTGLSLGSSGLRPQITRGGRAAGQHCKTQARVLQALHPHVYGQVLPLSALHPSVRWGQQEEPHPRAVERCYTALT